MNFQEESQKIRKERDQLLNSTIENIKKIFDNLSKEKVQKILNSSALELAQMLNIGETTSVQLVNIFAYRAGTIGNEIKAITDQNFLQALKLAAQCDDIRKSKGWKNALSLDIGIQQFSPLFGIPISIKDTVEMKGFSSTIGCIARYDQKEKQDGQIISVIKQAGLIPFVRTNIPQLSMNYRCNNKLWGNTENPWNRERTPGGSSGGQGALISARCSPLGLGGDIAGSLRIPAEFCGLCALKSTSQRITSGGQAFFSATISGQINIRGTMGPMSRSVQDLAAFLSIIMNKNFFSLLTFDIYRRLQPFDFKLYKNISSGDSKKFKIGYIDSLDLFPSTKASRRAIKQTRQVLTSKGHTLVPIIIPKVEQLLQLLLSILLAEGGFEGYQQMLDGEPMSQQYQDLKTTVALPKFIHWAAGKLLQVASPRMAISFKQVKERSASEYLSLSHTQKQLQRDFYNMWRWNQLDFIISPGFGIQAPYVDHKNAGKIGNLPGIYTSIYNVLDYTVGSIPISVVRKQQQQYQSKYNDGYQKETIQAMKGTAGLPVGIQVVGLPFKDQQVLGLMKVIERQIKFREKHHYPL